MVTCTSKIDLSVLDRPEVLAILFHPRPEEYNLPKNSDCDFLVPVEDDIVIGGYLHLVGKSAPNILFFHGNGEIVSDYHDLGPAYIKMGINFIPVDYRGYGRSTGNPTVTSMMKDCHTILAYLQNWLKDNDYTGPLIVMGRSLGSACALELAEKHQDRIDGLVVESGFAYIAPLLELLGVNVDELGITEDICFHNIEKIKAFNKPTLIIHAQYDHIIPLLEGRNLYDASPHSGKTFLMIPDANHNDIFFRGFKIYMGAIQGLLRSITKTRASLGKDNR